MASGMEVVPYLPPTDWILPRRDSVADSVTDPVAGSTADFVTASPAKSGPEDRLESTQTSLQLRSPVKLGNMRADKIAKKNSPEALRPFILQALAGADKRGLNLQGIQQYIEQLPDYQWDAREWMTVANDLLHQYEFPTVPVPIGNRLYFKLLRDVEPASLPFDPTPHHKKPFRFFDLPRIIRLKIYRYALQKPTPNGWQIDDHYTANSAALYTLKNKDDSLELRATVSSSGFTLRSPPLQTWLALLSVNKETFSEAMPIFYGHNTFRITSCATLYSWLRKMPIRRKFIGRIVLHYDPPLYDSLCSLAFKLLAETNLKFLKLEIDEIDVLNRGNGYGKVARLPGFYKLEKMRGLQELAFSGPAFEKTKKLLAKMLRDKPEGYSPQMIDIQEVENGKEKVFRANLRRELKKAVQANWKEKRRERRQAEKDLQAGEKARERKRLKKQRAREKKKRDDEKEAEREKKQATRTVQKKKKDREKELKREKRQKEREEAEEERARIRHNKEVTMLAKQGLQDQLKNFSKQRNKKRSRGDEAGDEVEAETAPKRAKTNATRGGGRGGARGAHGGARGGGRGGGCGGGRGGGRGGAATGRSSKVARVAPAKNLISRETLDESSDDDGRDFEDTKGHPILESEESEAE